jgi:formamidopyrimidine-DNA glycosylase
MDDASFFFCDPRNFGTMHCDMSLSALNKKLSSLGLDLLKQEHSLASFKRQVQRRKSKTIVEALMDQSITAGVGNYVKCEALWRSRISPFRVVATLSDTELTLLMESIRAVLLAAYHAHGHTMSDFVDLDGEKGQYSFKLSVYGHAHDILGNPVRRDETPDGRTTYWVPEMQR